MYRSFRLALTGFVLIGFFLAGFFLTGLTVSPLAAEAAETAEPSITQVTAVTVLVEDQDKALAWYTENLGFEVITDLQYSEDGRWLTIAPKGQKFPEISLERAGEARAALVGQGGSTVFATEDCRGTYEILKERGVEFVGEPQQLPWGTQAMFKDLYGNLLILLEASEQPYDAS